MTRGIVLLAVAAVVAAAIGGDVALRRSSAPATPAAVAVPTTAPYNPRPGPGGTRILTELVDPLTLAVPAGWTAPAADTALVGEINRVVAQAPPLAAFLRAQAQVAAKSAIRLFAYQAVVPSAFVSVFSFSSPGAPVLTPSGIAAIVDAVKKASPNVAASGDELPVGQVLKMDSTVVRQNQLVAVETLLLVAGGRTIQITMVSETTAAGIPPVFDQIAQSLRLG